MARLLDWSRDNGMGLLDSKEGGSDWPRDNDGLLDSKGGGL